MEDQIIIYKGAVLMRYFHSILGDDKFFNCLKEYLNKSSLGSYQDFKLIFSLPSKIILNSILDSIITDRMIEKISIVIKYNKRKSIL